MLTFRFPGQAGPASPPRGLQNSFFFYWGGGQLVIGGQRSCEHWSMSRGRDMTVYGERVWVCGVCAWGLFVKTRHSAAWPP